jgi:hypothetical protein
MLYRVISWFGTIPLRDQRIRTNLIPSNPFYVTNYVIGYLESNIIGRHIDCK